jgi:hypothetical protein
LTFHPLYINITTVFPIAVSAPNDTSGARQSFKENNWVKHFDQGMNSMGKFQMTSTKFQTTFKSQIQIEKMLPEFVFLNSGFVCDLEFDNWNFKQHAIFV